MICKKCGANNADGVKFCQKCGTPFTASDDAAKRKKRIRTLLLFLVIAALLVFLIADPLGIFEDAGGGGGGGGGDGGGGSGTPIGLDDLRDRFTTLKGNGEDTVTVMLYMIGSDLESRGGCATSDLVEIANATLSSKVNIIVEAGGAKSWQNDIMRSNEVERYRINTDGSFTDLNCSLGQQCMTDYRNLQKFIKYCKEEYPADRYILVMWDHGGGTLGGFGHDENYTSRGSMSLVDMGKALSGAGVKFDIVGFDACLMATIEAAYMLEPYADYMIASEETEPGSGWYYTNWITRLCANTSIPTKDLGKILIDDFVASVSQSSAATLSLVELREVPYLYGVACEYFSAAGEKITDRDFSSLSLARSNCRSYGENGFDQIDLIEFVKRAKIDGADKLTAAVDSLVVYSKSKNVSNAHGLAVYFPYSWLEYYSTMSSMQSQLGMSGDYRAFFDSFVSVMAGGQIHSGSGTAPEYESADWFDGDLVDNYGAYYDNYSYNELAIIEKYGSEGRYYALPLTAADWDIVAQIEIQAFFDDGDGLIDLGSDNMWETDDDGALAITFDNTWVSINGNTVSFYYLYETPPDADYWYTYGYSPAQLNGDKVDLIIRWDENRPEGYVVGARYLAAASQFQREIVPLKKGDKLEFLLDYYTYEGEFENTYRYNFSITVSGELTVSYEDLGAGDVLVWYTITDIYGNVYTTQSVRFSD